MDDDERSAARDALVGRTIAGRYVLRALIGGGGMGAVYAAEAEGGEVAIKLIDAELAKKPETLARFAREAQAMSAITSPHIAKVLDVGTEDGRPWIAMERLHGEDLGQRLRRDRRLPVAEALAITRQVLLGLARAHGVGIVHRDLKPDNVFLVSGGLAKIVDFGVSKIERPRDRTMPLALTGRGTILGTPFYMSPEQAQAKPELDARTDLYSVGAILFECLTGRPPHTRRDLRGGPRLDLPERRPRRPDGRRGHSAARRRVRAPCARTGSCAALRVRPGDARRAPALRHARSAVSRSWRSARCCSVSRRRSWSFDSFSNAGKGIRSHR